MMSGIRYADAVGAVRAMEGSLLSKNDIDQLIGARTNADLRNMLAAKLGSTTIRNIVTICALMLILSVLNNLFISSY